MISLLQSCCRRMTSHHDSRYKIAFVRLLGAGHNNKGAVWTVCLSDTENEHYYNITYDCPNARSESLLVVAGSISSPWNFRGCVRRLFRDAE